MTVGTITPAALVTGPTRIPLPFGLLSVATIRPNGDRWESGVIWETLTCDPAGGIGPWTKPSAEVQHVAIGGAGLTSFTLTFQGQTTAAIAANATAAAVRIALEALSNIAPGDVTVTGGLVAGYTFTFGGALADTNVTQMTATPTGGTGTVTVTTTTQGDSPIGLPKELGRNAETGEASQFTVYGHFTCSPVGFDPQASQDRATAHLLAREESRVEQALWTGDLGNTPTLKGATTVAGTAVDVATALGALESYIASQYGSQGVIHLTRQAALVGLQNYSLDVKGGSLSTRLGTPVIAGAGYDGSSPAGAAAAAGTSWAYVTPPIFGYRSDVFTSSNRPGDLLDRNVNEMYAIAERNYLLGFDPCGVGAALIALPA